MNNAYTIEVGAPLLRPGLTIKTTVSVKYVEPATREIMDLVRQINAAKPA